MTDTEECLKQAFSSSKTSGEAYVPTEGPKSWEMPLKDRISPVRNTYSAHPLPFLPDLLTPILSVRSVILLGRCEEERCRSGRQEAKGPPRRSRGQYLILSRYGQMWVRVRSVGCAAQPPLLGRWRNMRTLPVSISAQPGLLVSDLWQLDRRLRVQEFDLKRHKSTGY